jgi:hypothetical protein
MPRSFRDLIPAEIRTLANRGPPGPILSWAFVPFEAIARSNDRASVPTRVSCRCGNPLSQKSRPLGDRRDIRAHKQADPKIHPQPLRASTRTCPRSLPTTVMS